MVLGITMQIFMDYHELYDGDIIENIPIYPSSKFKLHYTRHIISHKSFFISKNDKPINLITFRKVIN